MQVSFDRTVLSKPGPLPLHAIVYAAVCNENIILLHFFALKAVVEAMVVVQGLALTLPTKIYTLPKDNTSLSNVTLNHCEIPRMDQWVVVCIFYGLL